jgi:Uma2 family endonuclease
MDTAAIITDNKAVMTLAHEPVKPSVLRVAMTEEEFLSLDEKRVELSQGEAIFMPPPSVLHLRVMGWLYRIACHAAERGNLGEVFADGLAQRFSSAEYTVPDVCFISAARLGNLKENHLAGSADLVIEVVSPDSRIRDYHEKFSLYERSGVREYWIVDPVYQTIDAYRLAEGKFVPIGPVAGIIHSEVLPGLSVDPEWLKQSPPPMPKE